MTEFDRAQRPTNTDSTSSRQDEERHAQNKVSPVKLHYPPVSAKLSEMNALSHPNSVHSTFTLRQLTLQSGLDALGALKTQDGDVVIFLPAGPNRGSNQEVALQVAKHLSQSQTNRVRLEVRVDDVELRSEGLGDSQGAEYSAVRALQGVDQVEVYAAEQPQNRSTYEAKLALRECAANPDVSQLLFPAHSRPYALRLKQVVNGLNRRGGVPGFLDVTILLHSKEMSFAQNALEWVSCSIDIVGERFFPKLMDRVALKEGRAGQLFSAAQRLKIKFWRSH